MVLGDLVQEAMQVEIMAGPRESGGGRARPPVRETEPHLAAVTAPHELVSYFSDTRR
jgi:hypothetical protein